MATQLGIGKSVAVLAVVVGCFSVLWPKIFFPMLQAVFYGTSPDTDTFADKVPGGPAADASSFLRRGQRDQRDLEMEELRRRLANAEALVQELLLGREDAAEVPVARSLSPAVGRSIGILVKELTLQSQRQAGLERRQERCCGAGSPARRATGRKVRGDPRPTCSCGAPLEGTTVEDLESDCDDGGWGRDSEDYDTEPALGSNEEETCTRASC
ncbi:hypothetical protein IscW_ISCW009271 [Ixodes scapularis]|uniref:Uncharacterized protein n=1 Tax=Ixodes scapularis TaxID=6945 RepID=B7Q0Y8_IXOSC|nr:hypothetical protein IscW_ISCW009271 [Ixodes scapularis]|eukprot:XP_002408657.1 hypothetical protein IscW_ISCW009271 [Ixodes scapularis]